MNYEADYDRALPVIDSVLRTAVFYQTNTDLLAIGNVSPNVLGPNGNHNLDKTLSGLFYRPDSPAGAGFTK